jgi:hypothetical protein
MKTFYEVENCIKTKLFVQTWNQAGDHIKILIWNQLLFHLVSELESNLESQINECI